MIEEKDQSSLKSEILDLKMLQSRTVTEIENTLIELKEDVIPSFLKKIKYIETILKSLKTSLEK